MLDAQGAMRLPPNCCCSPPFISLLRMPYPALFTALPPLALLPGRLLQEDPQLFYLRRDQFQSLDSSAWMWAPTALVEAGRHSMPGRDQQREDWRSHSTYSHVMPFFACMVCVAVLHMCKRENTTSERGAGGEGSALALCCSLLSMFC